MKYFYFKYLFSLNVDIWMIYWYNFGKNLNPEYRVLNLVAYKCIIYKGIYIIILLISPYNFENDK